MSTAAIDQNNKNTWTAYNEITGMIEPVRVDPVLGYVLVYAVAPDANIPTTLLGAKIDANNKTTLTAWNETKGIVESLRSGIDGSLLVVGV